MYTSTKHGKWNSPYDLIGFLTTSFQAIRAHATVGQQIDFRIRDLRKEEATDGPMRPQREESVHIRHLRNVQPMDPTVAEGVLAYDDLLKWGEEKLRGMLMDDAETVTEAGKSIHEAIRALDDNAPETSRAHMVEALETLQTLPNVDAGLELAGYGELEVAS